MKKRPSDTRFSVAALLASRRGLRYGMTLRFVTRANVDVTPAADASATKGSTLWCPPDSSQALLGAGCSVSAIPCHPASSAARATSATDPASSRSRSLP